MKTVFLAIPNYIFTSDLLRTKYIGYLASKYRVVVLTSFIDAEAVSRHAYFSSSNVVYVKYDLEFPKFWSLLKLLRISLVNEFDYLSSVKHAYQRPNYKNNWKRRMLRFSGKPFSFVLTANFFTKLEKLLLPKSKKFQELLSPYQPSLIITATPGFDPWEAELIIWAKRFGIPTVAINFTWDNLTMNSKHIRKTDYLIAWNRIMRKEAMDIHGYPADKVLVSGTPRFDPYFASEKSEPDKKSFLESKGLNPKYKTILHTTVTKAYPFQKKYIRDLITLREQKKIPYVNLFIRIHPLDIYQNYQEFFDTPDCHFEKAGQEITDDKGKKKIEMTYQDLLNLKYSLKYSDLNINYASTISIEACVFNSPIINIGYIDRFALAYDFNHYRPIYKSGAVRLAKTDQDLPKLINDYLENPSLDSDNRKRIVEQYVVFTDGLSYKRSVDLLEKII